MPLDSKWRILEALVTVTILPARNRGGGFDHEAVRIDPTQP